MLVTADTATLPSLSDTSATDAVKSSVSIVDAAPVNAAVDADHTPAPVPSEVHTLFAIPAEDIKYSLFSTLLADNVPSAKSSRSESAACFVSICV